MSFASIGGDPRYFVTPRLHAALAAAVHAASYFVKCLAIAVWRGAFDSTSVLHAAKSETRSQHRI